MTRLTFVVGGILTAVGLVSYLASGASSMTALIPSLLGVLMLIAAFVSRSPKARRGAFHASLVLAILGLAGSVMNVARLGELFAGTAERPMAVIASTITFAVLIVFLVVGIASLGRLHRIEPETDQTETSV